MKPGALLATLEAVPNEDRVSPPFAAAFSMMMLASTPAGDAYTFSEFDAMFREAGFGKSELIQLQVDHAADPHTLEPAICDILENRWRIS